MKTAKPLDCPECGCTIHIAPDQGGHGGEVTLYSARCVHCTYTRELGSLTGRKDTATREWNRFVKSRTKK